MRELLLLDLAGFRCAVRKEEILSHDEQSIHWLTDKEGPVTAIAMMGAHPVSLADLSYCLGLAPARRSRRYPVLVPADHDLSVGFVVDQETGEIQVPASAVFSLPAYLQTAFIDSCIELDGQLIPLINIQAVLAGLPNGRYIPPAPLLRLPTQEEKKTPSLCALRVFTYNKKSFATSTDYFASEQALSPGALTPLPLLPPFVRGVTLRHQQVLTVLDIGRYLQLATATEEQEEKWLVSTVAGQGFAFVVHGDQGILPAESVVLTPLPLLIRSNWRQQAILHARKIIPVLDIRELLTCQPHETGCPALSPRLQADSPFETAFGQEQVEILEFSLCNMVHALPDVEVLDTFPFTHCQKLTETRGLVVGVTLYKDKLLPVLDPARCFGRKSRPDPTWKFLLLCNGDLRALVMVEEVLGKRSLSLSEQRALPFTVPHSCVYGCYPVSVRVGLILNILALTVYFDDEQSSELFLFADDLLPPVQDIEETKETVESNIEQGEQEEIVDRIADQEERAWETQLAPVRKESRGEYPASSDGLSLSEEEESGLYHGPEERESRESITARELEEKASALLTEEQDSLVQAVVASMLTRKTDDSTDAEPGEFPDDSFADAAGFGGDSEGLSGGSEEADDIFSSVISAMLTRKGHGPDEEVISDMPELGQAPEEDVSEPDSDSGDREKREEESPVEAELHPGVSLVSFEAEIPQEKQEINASLDAPSVLLTEEQDHLLSAALASMLQSENAAPDECVPGDKKNDADESGSADPTEREEVDSEEDIEAVTLTDEQEKLLQSALVYDFPVQGADADSVLPEGVAEAEDEAGQEDASSAILAEELGTLSQSSVVTASSQEEVAKEQVEEHDRNQNERVPETIFAAVTDAAEDDGAHHDISEDTLDYAEEEQEILESVSDDEEVSLHSEQEDEDAELPGQDEVENDAERGGQENEAEEREARGKKTSFFQEKDERFVHDQLDTGSVSVELFDISVAKTHVGEEARKQEPSLAEEVTAGSSEILKDTYAFPDLEEFAEQIAGTEQVVPPSVEQPADFVKKAQFPPLLSPDPRYIKKRLDTLRQREDELLFQGDNEEQEEEEPQAPIYEKDDWRVKVWKVLFLLALLCVLLFWFFVLQHHEGPRGKFIEPEPQRVDVDGKGFGKESRKEPSAPRKAVSENTLEHDVHQVGEFSAREADQSTAEHTVPVEDIPVEKSDRHATQDRSLTPGRLAGEQAERKIPEAKNMEPSDENIPDSTTDFAEKHHALEDALDLQKEPDRSERAELRAQEAMEETPTEKEDTDGEKAERLSDNHIIDNTLTKSGRPVKRAEESAHEDAVHLMEEAGQSELHAQGEMEKAQTEEKKDMDAEKPELLSEDHVIDSAIDSTLPDGVKTMATVEEKDGVEQEKAPTSDTEDMRQYDTARTGVTAVLRRIGKVADDTEAVHQERGGGENKKIKLETFKVRPAQEASLELPEGNQDTERKENVSFEVKMPAQSDAHSEKTLLTDSADEQEGKQEEQQRKRQEERQESRLGETEHNKASENNSDISSGMITRVAHAGRADTGVDGEGKAEQKDAVPLPLDEKEGTPQQAHHTVTKGETLWKISEQYTGSGFNYPDVAKKNKIPNPDLIYPDQQVELPAKK